MNALSRVLNTPLSQTCMVRPWILRENNRTPGILSRTHKDLVIAPVLTCHILVYVLGRETMNKAAHRNLFFTLSLESSVWMFTCTPPSQKHTISHTPKQRNFYCCYSFVQGGQSKFTQAFPRFCQLGFCILSSPGMYLFLSWHLWSVFKWRLLWLQCKIASFFYFSLIYLTQSLF